MAVRQTYQMNAPSGNGGGVILGEPCDVKGRRLAGGIPWLLDMDITNRVRLGDTVAGGRSGISAPVVPYGGFGLAQRTVASGAQAVTADDCVIHCNGALANTTLNLFSAADNPGAMLYIHKNYDGFSVIVQPAGAQTISGEANNSFTTYRDWMVIQSDGANWQIIKYLPYMTNVLRNFDPALATSVGGLTDIATSANIFFWGRPTMLWLSTSMRNVQGADAFHLASFSIRIDGGAQQTVCDWSADRANNHQGTSGSIIIFPTQGTHTITLSFQRITGAGTSTINNDDFYTLTALQL